MAGRGPGGRGFRVWVGRGRGSVAVDFTPSESTRRVSEPRSWGQFLGVGGCMRALAQAIPRGLGTTLRSSSHGSLRAVMMLT